MIWIFSIGLSALGLIGIFLNISAYKKGEAVSSKKIVVAIMFVLLGGGVMLQKVKVIDNSELRQLLIAFDSEEQQKTEDQRKQELEEAEDKRRATIKKALDANQQTKERAAKLKTLQQK